MLVTAGSEDVLTSEFDVIVRKTCKARSKFHGELTFIKNEPFRFLVKSKSDYLQHRTNDFYS